MGTASTELKTPLTAMFERWDTDGSGAISPDEIRDGLKKMGMDVSDEVVRRIVAECDTDGNGVIDYQEFASAFGKGIGLAAYDLEAHGMVPAFQYDISGTFERLQKWGGRALIALAAGSFAAGAYWFHSLGAEHMLRAAGALAVLGLVAALMWQSPGFRLGYFLGRKGVGDYHAALDHVFGKETRYAGFRMFGWFGARTFLLRDAAMVDRALRHPDIYSRAEIKEYRPFNLHSILGTGSGERWLGYRIHFNDYFSKGFREDLPVTRALVAERMAFWKTRGEFDLMQEMFRLIVEVRGMLLFGERLGCFDDGPNNFGDLVDTVLTPPSFPFGGNGPAANRFHGRVTELISRCKKAGSVGYICRTLQESGEMTPQEALENASVYLLAHAPTTVLFWSLYRTAKNGTSARLRSDKTARLQAIKEELRLHPGVPLLFSRIVKKDDVNEGVRIPAGSAVLVSPLYLHRNPAAWVDADKFIPERWSFEKNEAKELERPITAEGDTVSRPSGCPVRHGADGQIAPRFVPFGGGQHKCQGRLLAVEEMALVVETILEQVDLELIRDDGLLDLPIPQHVQTHAYCRPVHDVKVRATAALK